jgi:hypothetical protein
MFNNQFAAILEKAKLVPTGPERRGSSILFGMLNALRKINCGELTGGNFCARIIKEHARTDAKARHDGRGTVSKGGIAQ